MENVLEILCGRKLLKVCWKSCETNYKEERI
jgi:hypothetical protein